MKIKFLFYFMILLFINCSDSSTPNSDNNIENDLGVWCVSENFIAGSGFFPVMNNPKYSSVAEIETSSTLNDNSKLTLLKINDQVYVYPYDYTNTYEVINDSFNNNHLAITYCPITESAICFNRELNSDQIITLKASGFLFKDNLIVSDINSEYYWSQMLNRGIRDNSKDIKLNNYNIVESSWSIVKSYFQNALVFNHENFVDCDCDETPTPIDYNNLFGILDEHEFEDFAHVFNFNNFKDGIHIEHLNVNRKDIVVVGSKNKIFFNAFYVPINTIFSTLEEIEFPNILKDNHGNIWDIFGYAVEGPNTGQKLDSPKSYIAAPWAWNEFFDNITFHN